MGVSERGYVIFGRLQLHCIKFILMYSASADAV